MTMQETIPKSSRINKIGYDAEKRELQIEFKGGNLYAYADVPPEKHAAFIAAESIGSYFAAHIQHEHMTFKWNGTAWDSIAMKPASEKSVALLRQLALANVLWSGSEGEFISPTWRGVVAAAGRQYEDAVRMKIVDWTAALLQSECSKAVDYLKGLQTRS